MRRDAWQALADPTRRQILEILQHTPQSINTIAEHFEISRPAISKQIKILEESKLLSINNQGRERICTLSMEPLKEIAEWVHQYEHFWLSKLDKLDQYLDKNNSKKNKT